MVDTIINKIHQYFSKEKIKIFLSVFTVGMLVHFALYTNQLLAYDGYWHYGSFLAKGWEISLGRFFIPFLDILRGTVVSSILSSIISIAIISFTTLILVDILKIRKTYIKILIGILLVVTPTFSLTLMYTYTADSYTLAFLFAVLSVYFLNKTHNRKNILLSIICIILTLGLYQAYLCIIVTLCAITYLIKLCTETDITLKEFTKKIATDIGILLIGTIIYYIIFTIIVKILNLNITDYNGGSRILSIETLKNLVPAIKSTYITFYQFNFKNNIIENTEFVYRNIFNAIMFLLILINFAILIKTNKIYKTPYKIAIILLLILMFPIFSCVIELIAQATKINLLMASALYLPMILLMKQIDILENRILKISSLFIILISLWTFILSDNATYVATDLYNKQMTAVGNRIIERLENNDEVTKETPICIIGKMNFSIHNPRILKLTNFDVTNVSTWTWQIYLQDNLALGRDIYTMESYDDIINSTEFANMGIFPSKESIKKINDKIVVKIGDVSN